jgi:uracil-DNA glycosylase
MNKVNLFDIQSNMRQCQLCLEAGYQITPGAIFTGNLQATIMVIGQAPGRTEVEAKRPFNAGSGRRLFQWLGEAGWDENQFRRDQYMTAITKCYPGKNDSGRGDRVPSKPEQELCQPFLRQELKLVTPRLIIPVGGLAVSHFYNPRLTLKNVIGTAKYVPGDQYKEILTGAIYDVEVYRSFRALFSKDGHWIVPLPHPSGASIWPNNPDNKLLIKQAIDILNAIRFTWSLN